MPLPKKGTPELDTLVKDWQGLKTPEERDAFAIAKGYDGSDYFQRRLRERGVKTERITTTAPPVPAPGQPPPIIVPRKDAKIKPFKVGKERRDEEDIGIVLSDHHAGRKTDTYNKDTYAKRMDALLDSCMTIINLHRPIRNAYILELGDMIQGESVYKGANVEETETGAYGQIFDIALPAQETFILSLAQGVEQVHVYGARGNHGKYDKTATPRTNWDNFLYKALNDRLANQKNINVHTSTEFYQLFSIRGFRFFIVHGDQVRSSQGIPLFALRRKFQEWYAYCNGFNYAYCGHWHVGGYDHINSHADYTICPPMVTGDTWALEVVGRASKPVQLAFGIHNRYGRTWQYNLHCDKDFLPQHFNGEIEDA